MNYSDVKYTYNPPQVYKIVLLGVANSGKTSIVNRIIKNDFVETESTIGASFNVLNYMGKKFEIWDTGGQERFLALIAVYYRNAHLYLVVCDVKNKKSIEKIGYYLNEIRTRISDPHDCLILCNKTDLVTNIELGDIEMQIKKIIEEYHDLRIDFLYTSSKTGEGIDILKDKIIAHTNNIVELVREIHYDKINIVGNENLDNNKCGCV